MIRKLLLMGFVVSCAGISGCQSPKQLITPPVSYRLRAKQDPKFLRDITLDGSTNSFAISGEKNKAAVAEITLPAGFVPSFTNNIQQKYASILGVIPQAITNFSLYGFIEEWYGVHYRMGGNSREGIDCSAFVQRLYEHVFCTDLLRSALEQFGKCSLVFNTDSLREGDLVFFRTHGRRVSHVGIYLVNHFFVHASATRGVTISSLDEQYWRRTYAGAGKVAPAEGRF